MGLVRIGSTSVGLTIIPLSKPGPGPYDFGTYDVTVQNGRFSGGANCYFNTGDLKGLRDALKYIHRELSGSYQFEPLEGQLQFVIKADKFGHVGVEGELFEVAGDPANSLKFYLGIDQTFLPGIIVSLNELLG